MNVGAVQQTHVACYFSISMYNQNKVGYMATPVACGQAGAVIEKFTGAFGQE